MNETTFRDEVETRLTDAETRIEQTIAALEGEVERLREERDQLRLLPSVRCDRTHWQACHICERYECGDNTSPAVKEIKRLREACETERAIAKRLAAECAKWEARVERMDIEATRLRDTIRGVYTRVQRIQQQGRIAVPAAMWILDRLHAALEPQP